MAKAHDRTLWSDAVNTTLTRNAVITRNLMLVEELMRKKKFTPDSWCLRRAVVKDDLPMVLWLTDPARGHLRVNLCSKQMRRLANNSCMQYLQQNPIESCGDDASQEVNDDHLHALSC